MEGTKLKYPDGTICEMLEKSCRENSSDEALDFLGQKINFNELKNKIDAVAAAFAAMGIGEGDCVSVALPNIPQAVACFYGLNKIGALPSMIHPLSAEAEIAQYLKMSKSKAVVTLDSFYEKTAVAVRSIDSGITVIVASVQDELAFPKNVFFSISNRKKRPDIPYGKDGNVISWKAFIKGGAARASVVAQEKPRGNGVDSAVILYSGGTTGTSKGIVLSNANINALAVQTLAASGFKSIKGFKMLSVMPLFHGFGLGIGIHLPLVFGASCVLLPRFDIKTYAEVLVKKRPDFIPGVPTLFEALLRAEKLKKADLAFLKGVFCGGDSLSTELKRKVDSFLEEHGATVRIREGYGTTESVTACCLTPHDRSKEGSIGLPFSDTYFAVTEIGGTRHLPCGEEGEICLRGPTVMKGYLDDPEETAAALRLHDDGNVWLHTGDLGIIDEEGFVYFKQRIKRMIITSGYNVYPSQIENILEKHEKVLVSCVIGVKDRCKIQAVKAFIVLKPQYAVARGTAEEEAVKRELTDYCRKNIARYAVPSSFEIRDDLPRTAVGKVAYRELEKESENFVQN